MEEQVKEVVELIRPAVQADGVNLQLVGACGTCPSSVLTLKAGIERIMMDRVPGVREVIAV